MMMTRIQGPSKEATGEEEEDQPLLQPLSQQESVSLGIPIGHKMRRGGTKMKDPKRYPLKCPLWPERYQRTNDLTDHHYVNHLHKTYDCTECMKQYNSNKSLRLHFKTEAPEHRQIQVFRAPMWMDRPGPRKTPQSPPETA